MSTSLLYHAFCVRTHDHVRTEFRDGAVYEHLHKKPYPSIAGQQRALLWIAQRRTHRSFLAVHITTPPPRS